VARALTAGEDVMGGISIVCKKYIHPKADDRELSRTTAIEFSRLQGSDC
jgi:hypothetical protein